MKLPEGYVPGVGLVKTKGGFGGFGQKMLERMGWERGQGLGKDKAGRQRVRCWSAAPPGA